MTFVRRQPPTGQIMRSPPLSSLPSTAAAQAVAVPPPPTSLRLPDTGFLRQSQVLQFVPISKSTLWRRVEARTFPPPVKLSPRVTVWRAEEIRRWIAQQVPSS
ncbi:helix-turn-helix transcriptional regulator [Sphaerotilus sp.]|uniref:helix-turn-helix transcriptional regulator n=1 Tax=Sphaerotilus sp. TaxID=2093942 RepID=UPI002ACD8A03|nr:AlpA family phage regulatory protein [Sphaerotilus sp.]MDZ7855914.1 AlpA family phage regulatory protein [Sphaerotilus sp.]